MLEKHHDSGSSLERDDSAVDSQISISKGDELIAEEGL